MSRILRRPMFRGGRAVSSYGNGIASGLAKGGQIGGGSIAGKAYSDGRYGFENPRFVNLGGGSGTTSSIPTSQTGQGILSRAGNFFNKYNPLTRANFTKAGNIMRSGYGMATGPAAYGTAAALSGPAFIGGLAYLNRPTTVKELEFMKKYDAGQIGSIIDETTSEDEFNQYEADRKEYSDPTKYTPLGTDGTGLLSSIEELSKAKQNVDPPVDAPTIPEQDDTVITEEDYISMLGGDKARRRDVGDMLTRASALALKRGKPGEGKRTFTDIASDIMAAESAAGPSRLERIEEKAADYKIKDKIASKRNKESIELMKAQVDYQKRKSIYEALAEQQRAGNFGAKGMSASIQQTTGKVPKVTEDVTIVQQENLTKSQIGQIYIVKTKDKKTKAETLTTVEIIEDANGNPTSKVLIQQ
tara:strand:- start:1818 stop:3062 length:1245 start_codon:yes stop_codon:yes gene_type:complete